SSTPCVAGFAEQGWALFYALRSGLRRAGFSVFFSCAHRSLKPFRQSRLPGSEHRRDRQFSPIMLLLAQTAEITGTDSFEHAGQAQRALPAVVLANQGNPQGHTLCRRLWFPFVTRIQHFRDNPPNESRALIGYPETAQARTAFQRMLHTERHLLHAEQRTGH